MPAYNQHLDLTEFEIAERLLDPKTLRTIPFLYDGFPIVEDDGTGSGSVPLLLEFDATNELVKNDSKVLSQPLVLFFFG